MSARYYIASVSKVLVRAGRKRITLFRSRCGEGLGLAGRYYEGM